MQGKSPSATEFVKHMQDLLRTAKTHLEAAQHRQKAYADQNRTEAEFQIEQRVLLSTKNMEVKATGTRKFLPKFIGPFKVLKRHGPVAYELEVPPSCKSHDVFHVSLLEEFHSDGDYQPPLPTVMLEGEDEFEVESILMHRQVKKHNKSKGTKLEFLVKWRGEEAPTWEPEQTCVNCPQQLKQYWDRVSQGGSSTVSAARKPSVKAGSFTSQQTTESIMEASDSFRKKKSGALVADRPKRNSAQQEKDPDYFW